MKSTPKKPPPTDAERHRRFKAMAKEIGAEESSQAFDRAFAAITTAKPKN